jgi:hypothetical protein
VDEITPVRPSYLDVSLDSGRRCQADLRLLTLLLFFCGCVVALVAASCGGLMATKLYTSAQSKAAGWNQAGNFGGGVLGAALVLRLVEHLPFRRWV